MMIKFKKLADIKKYILASLWIIGTAVLIAAVHFAATFQKESPIYVYETAGRFFAPLLASFFCVIVIQPEDLHHAFVISIIIIFLSIAFIIMAYVMPCFIGVGEALDLYFVFAMREVFISAIFIFPTSLVGAIVGCAFITR